MVKTRAGGAGLTKNQLFRLAVAPAIAAADVAEQAIAAKFERMRRSRSQRSNNSGSNGSGSRLSNYDEPNGGGGGGGDNSAGNSGGSRRGSNASSVPTVVARRLHGGSVNDRQRRAVARQVRQATITRALGPAAASHRVLSDWDAVNIVAAGDLHGPWVRSLRDRKQLPPAPGGVLICKCCSGSSGAEYYTHSNAMANQRCKCPAAASAFKSTKPRFTVPKRQLLADKINRRVKQLERRRIKSIRTSFNKLSPQYRALKPGFTTQERALCLARLVREDKRLIQEERFAQRRDEQIMRRRDAREEQALRTGGSGGGGVAKKSNRPQTEAQHKAALRKRWTRIRKLGRGVKLIKIEALDDDDLQPANSILSSAAGRAAAAAAGDGGGDDDAVGNNAPDSLYIPKEQKGHIF
jgi:hypothetical protein